MLITTPTTTPTLIGGGTPGAGFAPQVQVSGGAQGPASPPLAQSTARFLQPTSASGGGECSSCCQREELMMSIERRDEQMRSSEAAISRAQNAFAASRG